MCKPVRYVYPHCGHLIVQDKDVWTVERCPFARCYNRDCWIPNDVAEHLIKETLWPYNNLTEPCLMPHEQDDSTESATLAASSVAGEQVPYYKSCVEKMASIPTSPEAEDIEEKEMDRIIKQILFREGLPAECSGVIAGQDEFHLDEDDFIPQDDQLLLLDEQELGHYEADLAQATPFSDDKLAYFNEIIAQTADELSFAGVEDNIEWEKVQAVEAPLGQSGLGEDMMNTEWCFDEWF